jgi:hypothetical protein
MNSSFWKSGHTPTLFAAFLYFDLSFMVWYLLGPLAVQIAGDLHLTTQQRGLVVATPILAGAVLRFAMGMLADRLSPKTAGLIGQVIVICALFGAWKLGIHSYEQALLLGLFLGMAGASFAVALPLASQWYPPQHQGKAMGIAGAGNSGTVLAALIAPVLAAAFGWSNVFGFALIPLILTLIVFAWLAKNAPERPKAKSMADYFKALGDRDSWWFMFFYSVTFGGFIGLASALPGYFQRPVWPEPGDRRLLHRCLRVRWQPDASIGWCPGGSLRWHPHLAGNVHRVSDLYCCRRIQLAKFLRGAGAFRLHHARFGGRQRCGFPVGPTAFSPRNRRNDRFDRHGWRYRRFCPGSRHGCDQTKHWQLPAGVVVVRQPGGASVVRPARRETSLENHVGFGSRDRCAGLRS